MISLESVSVVYPGGVLALRETDVTFRAGEFTVLIGASGAGKSTLLRCLNGLVTPTSGRITADGLGEVMRGAALRAHRRRTAMVFQQHQLIGRQSVLKNVLTGRLGYHSSWRTLLPLSLEERRLALDCVERVGLLDFALRRADQLSGGQQQRVGIARALAQRPSLILADEPVASLDPETSRKVLGQLYEICRSDGIAAIVSLHQVQLARDFADRMIGIADGEIQFDCAPDDVTEHDLNQIYRRTTAATKAETEEAAEPAPALALAME
ncbi:MAG: phosphonate ABC transporter ATP-binding protein [Pseudomonadota bacterium]